MNPTKTVDEICAAIERYQLMSSKDFAAMRARWFRPDRKDAANPDTFRRWLVSNRYLTDFVARVLSGRKADQLVLNQYRLQDQLISGPMAGSYLAIDSLDRHVAIEVLASTSAADPAMLRGFQQAASKAMEVDHPNVGRILDCGQAHGLHYLVKEYYEGQTVEDILQKRGKIPYQQATRVMALALAGLDALHSKGVPAGDLTADCLLLAAGDSPKERTVKILHAGVQRRLFDETAIGRSISIATGIPDELALAESCTFCVTPGGAVEPAEDIFRLGCTFYRCVTGQEPFPRKQLPHPSSAANPIAGIAPEVPEMLCQIIEQMIDPQAANRPQKAAHVAKSLRVFLAAEAEEQAREVRAEEHLVVPPERTAARVQEEPAEEVEPDEEGEEEEAPARPQRKKALAQGEGAWGKAVELWDELQPQLRDLVFLAFGALVMLALIFLIHFITGLGLPYIAGLATGVVASYFVERFVRWRQEQKASTT
jgi:serine/threonine protein kinase